MSCAAIDDVMAWSVLAIASSFSKDDSARDGGFTCMLALFFVLAMFFLVRPALHFLHRRFLKRGDEMNSFFLGVVFLMMLVGAFTAEVIGIHAFFGAFIGQTIEAAVCSCVLLVCMWALTCCSACFSLPVAGVIMPKQGILVHELLPKMELLTREFLLPLYFASSGIKTNLGSLNSGLLWGYTIAIIGLASAAKFLPSLLVGKLCTGRDWRFCTTLGLSAKPMHGRSRWIASE